MLLEITVVGRGGAVVGRVDVAGAGGRVGPFCSDFRVTRGAVNFSFGSDLAWFVMV